MTHAPDMRSKPVPSDPKCPVVTYIGDGDFFLGLRDGLDYRLIYSVYVIEEENNRHLARVFLNGRASFEGVKPHSFMELFRDDVSFYRDHCDADIPPEDILVGIADVITELGKREIKNLDILIMEKINEA
jgi:hypothetical protein